MMPTMYLYFDADLNTVTLAVQSLVLYTRGPAQRHDVPYWLLTPSAYAALHHRVTKADDEWAAGRLPAEPHRRICEAWAVIDAYAREHLDPALIEDAFARQRRIGRPIPLPKVPDRREAWCPWAGQQDEATA
jgi:hypothetical protein